LSSYFSSEREKYAGKDHIIRCERVE
jgi:hypothetical protein